jgi:hypothetical protein
MPVRRTFTDTRPSAQANAQDRAGDVSLPDLAHRTPLSSQQESEVTFLLGDAGTTLSGVNLPSDGGWVDADDAVVLHQGEHASA